MKKHVPVAPGERFDRFTVLRDAGERDRNGRTVVLAQCSCGSPARLIRVTDLRRITGCRACSVGGRPKRGGRLAYKDYPPELKAYDAATRRGARPPGLRRALYPPRVVGPSLTQIMDDPWGEPLDVAYAAVLLSTTIDGARRFCCRRGGGSRATRVSRLAVLCAMQK